MTTRSTFVLLASFLVASCTSPLGPQDSGIAAPQQWTSLAGAAPTEGEAPLAGGDAIEVEQRWWRSFRDPTLDRLIAGAIAENKTLRVAEARVAEAQAAEHSAKAELFPNIFGTGGLSRSNEGVTSRNKPISVKEADLNATWEIDLFGKNQARTAAAAAIRQSEEANRQAVMVALLAEVARAYFDLRNDQEQLQITERNLATQQQTLDLIKSQQTGALSSGLDVERAAAQVATTAAEIPALRSDRKTQLDRLNVLLGATPGSEDGWLTPAVAPAPLDAKILVAAPAKVLANRPDVRVAERSLAASRSSLEAATRELYPTISLAGLYGIQDSSLFSHATPWTAAANVSLPLLDFGRIRARIDAADAQEQQAFFSYQETVLEALEDMENAIALYLEETGRQRELATAADQSHRAVGLADQQYRAGFSQLLDLLVAERDELAAESSLAASNALLRKNLVHVYTAAGGGWQL